MVAISPDIAAEKPQVRQGLRWTGRRYGGAGRPPGTSALFTVVRDPGARSLAPARAVMSWRLRRHASESCRRMSGLPDMRSVQRKLGLPAGPGSVGAIGPRLM